MSADAARPARSSRPARLMIPRCSAGPVRKALFLTLATPVAARSLNVESAAATYRLVWLRRPATRADAVLPARQARARRLARRMRLPASLILKALAACSARPARWLTRLTRVAALSRLPAPFRRRGRTSLQAMGAIPALPTSPALMPRMAALRTRRTGQGIREHTAPAALSMASGLRPAEYSASCSRRRAPGQPGCPSSALSQASSCRSWGTCYESGRLLRSGRRCLQSRHRTSAATRHSDGRSNPGQPSSATGQSGDCHGWSISACLRGSLRQTVRMPVSAGDRSSSGRGCRDCIPSSGDSNPSRRRRYVRRVRRRARGQCGRKSVSNSMSIGGHING